MAVAEADEQFTYYQHEGGTRHETADQRHSTAQFHCLGDKVEGGRGNNQTGREVLYIACEGRGLASGCIRCNHRSHQACNQADRSKRKRQSE